MALSDITTHIQFLSILIVKVQFKNIYYVLVNNIRYVAKHVKNN